MILLNFIKKSPVATGLIQLVYYHKLNFNSTLHFFSFTENALYERCLFCI